jgi:hypothetical protein
LSAARLNPPTSMADSTVDEVLIRRILGSSR